MRVLTILLSLLIVIPTTVFAQGSDFVPLVGIPGLDPAEPSVEGYINALYILSISIAAFLAVVRIIFAGVQYMLSDIVTDKGNAKKDIQAAVLGLLIVLGAVLLLETINPQLKNFGVLDSLKRINTQVEGLQRVEVVRELPIEEHALQKDRDDTLTDEVADDIGVDETAGETIVLRTNFTGSQTGNSEFETHRRKCRELNPKNRIVVINLSLSAGLKQAKCIQAAE